MPEEQAATSGELVAACPDEVSVKTATGDVHRRKCHEDCKVTVNGKETTLDDLKRADRVLVKGDPATEIQATR